MIALKLFQLIEIRLVEDSRSDADWTLEKLAESKFFNKTRVEYRVSYRCRLHRNNTEDTAVQECPYPDQL